MPNYRYTAKACLISAAVGQLIFAGANTVHASTAIEEVIVTAQKRAESVQDVPASISALSAGDLEALNFANSNDIAAQIPNMQVSGPFGDVQPIFSIRGISMSDYNSNQASPVGVYLDEMYLGATYTHGLQFFDLERLEVLRGPQGTLYGKNTTGGAINIISKKPSLDGVTDGYLALGAGNFNRNKVEGAIESALIEDKLASRFAFSYNKADGYFKNHAGKDLSATDNWAARLSLNYQVTDDLNAVLRVFSGKSDPVASGIHTEGTLDLGGPELIDYTGYSKPASYDLAEGDVNKVEKTIVETDGASLTLQWDQENYSLISISSWYTGDYFQGADTDGSSLGLLEIDWSAEVDAISQDLRLVSNLDSPLNYIVGAYYAKEQQKTHNAMSFYESFATAPIPLPAFGIADQRYEVEKESIALYGQVTYGLTDKLDLTLGLRYTEDENSFFNANTSNLAYDGSYVTTFFPFGGTYNDFAPKTDFIDREWSGKFSLDYKLDDNTLLYSSYSRGYRSGSFSGGIFYDPAFFDTLAVEPEFMDAYEIGVKTQLLDDRLQLNASAFFYDYTDQQFVNVIGISASLENAGSSEITGLDIELLAKPSDNLTVQLSLGLLDTEYKELSLSNPQTNMPIDLSGNELISAPELNFSAAIDYEFAQTDLGTLVAHVDATFAGDQWYSAYNDQAGYGNIVQEDYWLTNARLALEAEGGQYTLALWVKNLEDKSYNGYGINLQSGFGYDYFTPAPPRTYGLDFTWRFQ